MKKSVCKILCPISGGVFLVLALYLGYLACSLRNALASAGASVGIIGGAGAPTQMFLLQRSPIWGILLIGLVALVTCIVTGVMLLIPDKKS